MVPFVIAAALTASQPLAPAPAVTMADADPAIWVVNDHDTTIFLFGTFHALDGKSNWFNDEVRTAFNQSDELVLETLVPERPDEIIPRPLTETFAPPPPPLPSYTLTASANFLASTRMAISAGRESGMDVKNGADMVLRREAQQTGKPVEGLESFEFQLGMFARMPPQRPRPGTPVESGKPKAVNQLAAALGQMEAAWNHGDVRVFAAMLDQMQRQAPESYKIMFVDRNCSWAKWIAERLKTPGRVFVAVGAGHLAGPDSVQAQLATLGVRSARIN